MNTISKSYPAYASQTETRVASGRFQRMMKTLEFSHFSLIAMAILIGSCLGSIATMKVFENHAPDWQFMVSLAFTMANLIACIAQAPTRYVVTFFAASIVVNLAILAANLL